MSSERLAPCHLEKPLVCAGDEVKINNSLFSKSESIVLQQDESDIVLSNNNIAEADIIIFGGQP